MQHGVCPRHFDSVAVVLDTKQTLPSVSTGDRGQQGQLTILSPPGSYPVDSQGSHLHRRKCRRRNPFSVQLFGYFKSDISNLVLSSVTFLSLWPKVQANPLLADFDPMARVLTRFGELWGQRTEGISWWLDVPG